MLCLVLSLPYAALPCPADVEHAQGLEFSGFTWEVKQAKKPVGPGPNYFSARSVESSADALVLSARSRAGNLGARYECAEIFSREWFPYGTFSLTFRRSGPLDRNAVFGFFLYDGENPPYFSEVDFEMARWGIPGSNEAQFAVQPARLSGNYVGFNLGDPAGTFRVAIAWSHDRVVFSLRTEDGSPVREWTYTGEALPLSRSEAETTRVHLNFWMFGGQASAGDGALSIELLGFSFVPAGDIR